jgi:hypothetical protein
MVLQAAAVEVHDYHCRYWVEVVVVVVVVDYWVVVVVDCWVVADC